MLAGEQIRAARGMLNWSVNELAQKIGVSHTTITSIELGTNKRPLATTVQKILRVFENAGLEFTDGCGVKKRSKDAEIFEGKERFDDFCGYMYTYLHKHGGECIINATDERWLQSAFRDLLHHRAIMMSLIKTGRVSGRILAAEGNFQTTWAKLRRSPKTDDMPMVTFICFGECLALVSFEHEPSPYVILCRSNPIADEFRRIFNTAWDRAEDL